MWTVIGTILIVAASIGTGVVVDRKWSVLPRKGQLAGPPAPKQLDAPGAAPASAIAAGPGEIELLRRGQKCSCRTAMDVAADGDRVTYEGHELRVLRFACPRCGATRSLYVRES
jgi:hypothetical protein